MPRRNHSLLSALVVVLALGSGLIAPAAGALSPKAAIPAAKSGITVRALSRGGRSVCAILASGAVKCWGANTAGTLGLGDDADRGDNASEMGDFLATVNLGAGLTAKAIAVGYQHSCALLDNGKVKCWGTASGGLLGSGDDADRGDAQGEMGDNLPYVDLGTGAKAKAISAGNFFTCALLMTGAVKCWGANSFGQLGVGSADNIGTDAAQMGDNLVAVDLGPGRKAKAIASSSAHTCALLDNGSVKCWGGNASGQLGQGDMDNRGDAAGEMGAALPAVDLGTRRKAKAVTVGADHSCALLDNGSVKCWGDNQNGQLGLGDPQNRGDNGGEMGNALPTVNLGTRRKAKAITSSGNQTCALLDNGSMKCWGANDFGQLGNGDNSGAKLALGDEPNEMGDLLPALDLGAGRRAILITTGVWHTCALLDNRTVKCWGGNQFGQLGLGDTAARGNDETIATQSAVNLGVQVKSISAAVYHSCAILVTNMVECWGLNDSGQLGQGNTNNRGDEAGEMGDNLAVTDLGTGRTAKSLSTGTEGRHTCAILDNNTVKCWGNNEHGQLGYGDMVRRGSGGPSSAMGDLLLPVNLGTKRKARQIVVGDAHTCALLDNGTVKCWGENDHGELGIGSTIPRGDTPAADHAMGDALPTVDLGRGRKARALAAGMNFTCALLDNNTVKCWGSNDHGQLGIGNKTNRGDSADAGHEMGNLLPAVDLGTGRTAKAISSGDAFVCALLDNRTVKCWGYNGDGELGLGSVNAPNDLIGDQPSEMGDNLPAVEISSSHHPIAISSGGAHSCVLLNDRTVKCWGFNGDGELGLGTATSHGDSGAAGHGMGDLLPAVAFTG